MRLHAAAVLPSIDDHENLARGDLAAHLEIAKATEQCGSNLCTPNNHSKLNDRFKEQRHHLNDIA
jgi:hypothetical protein